MSKLIVYLILSGLSSGIYSILVMFFMQYLDGNVGSLYLAHYSLYYLVGNLTVSALLIPAGIFTDKIGRKRALTIGVSLIAIGGFIAPLSTQWWHLLFASAILSAGSAMTSPAQASLVADISAGYRREKSYGVVAFASVGFTAIGLLVFMVYSALFGGILLSDFYYRFMLTVSAVLALVAVIPIFLMRRSPVFDRDHATSQSNSNAEQSSSGLNLEHSSKQSVRPEPKPEYSYLAPEQLRKNRVVQKILLINIMVGLGAGFIIPLFTYYWQEVFNISQFAVVAITALGYIGMALGSLMTPWVARHAAKYGGRVGTIVAFQSASILFAGYLAVVPWQMNLPLAVIAYIARTDFMNIIGPLTSALLMDHSPMKRRGVINSMVSIAFSVPNGISPYFTSMILNVVPAPYGYTYSISALVVLYSIGAVIYLTTRKADRLVRLSQQE
jgi:MFS family permease